MATSPSALITRLLDRDYNGIVSPVLNALSDATQSGIVKQRLAELNAEAQRLTEEGKRLTPDNAILRATLADLETALRNPTAQMSSAATPLQESAITQSGKIQRQLALPGMTDAQLARFGIPWNTPDPEAVAQLVGYSQSPAWRAALAQFPDDITQLINNQAIRGIIYGWSPLRTAREIANRIETFPLYQAQNLMRTLQLTSYRDATAIHQNANRDIADQIIRIAALDRRTCLSCVALHGTVIWDSERDSTAPVPRVDDHYSGRCTAVIIVKNRPRNITTGIEWWNNLTPERQAQQNSLARSPGKLEALRNGSATLTDFVHTYNDDTFGRMLREASLKDVLAR